MLTATEKIKIATALLDVATVIRHVRRTPAWYEQNNAFKWFDGVDGLVSILKTHHELFVSTVNSQYERPSLEYTFINVYMKGVDVIRVNDAKAWNQTKDVVKGSRHGKLAYVDEENATYEEMSGKLDDINDFEDDGGFALLKANMHPIQYRIARGLAYSFASHVLNNKFILAKATWNDLQTHIESTAVEISHNFKMLRRFKGTTGTIVSSKSKLAQYNPTTLLNPAPQDETKFRTTLDKVEITSSFERKKNYRHRQNFKWCCPLNKSELLPKNTSTVATCDMSKMEQIQLVEHYEPIDWIPDGDDWIPNMVNSNIRRFK